MRVSFNRKRRSVAGFSLADLLLVIGLTMVVGAMAVPAMRSTIRNYRLAASADRLAAELNAARVSAVSRGTTYRLDISTSQKTFRIVDLSDVNNPTRVARSLGSDVSFGAVPANPILFTSRGAARGGTIELLTNRGKKINIIISPSGKTPVEKHDEAPVEEEPAY